MQALKELSSKSPVRGTESQSTPAITDDQNFEVFRPL